MEDTLTKTVKAIDEKNAIGDSSNPEINIAMNKLEKLKSVVNELIDKDIEVTGIDLYMQDYRSIEQSILQFSNDLEPIYELKNKLEETHEKREHYYLSWKSNVKKCKKQLKNLYAQRDAFLEKMDNLNMKSKKIKPELVKEYKECVFKIEETERLRDMARENMDRMKKIVVDYKEDIKTISLLMYQVNSVHLRMRHLIVMTNKKVEPLKIDNQRISEIQSTLVKSLNKVKELESERKQITS